MKSVGHRFRIVELLLLVLILFISVAIRFNNFSNRVTYGPEQARSLIVAGRNIKDGFSLLGQEYFRYSSRGHKLFYSATFTYSLVPLLLLFKYNPVYITAYFTILNIITGFTVYFLVRKMMGSSVALFSLIIFLFNSYMIYHSMFLWPYNYLPLFGILSLYLVYKFKKNNNFLSVLLLGVISGLGFGIQYLYLPFALIVFGSILFYSKNKIKYLIPFVAGAIIGDLPMILFDLRHNFYNFQTLSNYFLDTLKGQSDASFNYYYLLPLWAVGAVAIGWVTNKIYKNSKLLGIFVMVIYVFLNLNSHRINYKKPTGMSDGLRWSDIYKAAEVIAKDKPSDFNVASLLDFDTRGYILRYPVEIMFGYHPMGEEDYPRAKTLYVISQNSYDFQNPKVWELQSVQPYTVKLLETIGLNSGYGVYKLTKQ
jgi:hypothetical protein